MGLRVVTLDNRPANPGHALADRSYPFSTTDFAGVLSAAKTEKISGILAPCTDAALPAAAATAAALGLPSPSLATTEITGDKLRFRQFQNEHRLPHPRFLEAGEMEKSAPFSGPWIAKPLRASGSKGVTWFDQWDTAAGLADNAKSFCLRHSALIEEAIPGSQMTCEGILQNGRIAWSMLTHRHTGKLPHPATVGHTYSEEAEAAVAPVILPQIENLWRRLGYSDGPFDVDLVMGDERLVILECAPRLGGNHLSKLARYLGGISLAECAIRHALGIPLPPLPRRLHSGFVRLLVAPAAGCLQYAPERLERARAHRGVEEIEMDVPPGSPVQTFTDGRQRLGHVVARANSREEEDLLVAGLLEMIEWKITPWPN